MYNFAPIGYFTLDENELIEDVNIAGANLLGLGKNKLINRAFIRFIASKSRNRFFEYVKNFRENKEHLKCELELLKDEKTFPVIMEINSLPNDEGGLESLLITVIDIKELKKAEKELKIASLYNRSLIEASLDPLVTIGADGKITDVNNATEVVTGYSRDFLIGTDFSDYFTEPDKAKEGYKTVFEEGFVRDYPLDILNRDGNATSVLYNATVYRDQSGDIVGVFAAARDITERKKAEENLHKSEQKYRNIFEESFDGLFITSPEGKILDMNKKGIEMFGYDTKEELLRLDLERDVYADPTDRKRILDMVNRGGSAEYEIVVKKKNGDKMITLCSLTAVKDEKGVINSYRGIIRDITQRKKDENAILQAKEEWENTFDAVPDLIAILDTNYRIIRANKAMANKLGVTPEEAVGFTCYEVVHGLNEPPSFKLTFEFESFSLKFESSI